MRKEVNMERDISIFKDKYPDSIQFIRNTDGTYKVIYTGIAGVDEDNKVICNSIIEIPKAKLKWDKNGFLPVPMIEEILKSDDNDDEIFSVIVPEEKKYPLCPKVDGDVIPRCLSLKDRKYCTGNMCSKK